MRREGSVALVESEQWLDGLINRERQPTSSYARVSLEPIESLLAALGHPERALSVIHIAGSKGKGSTALLTEAVLRSLGERTGVFTSPHLVRWTERFRIDGREVGGDLLAHAIAKLRPHVEVLRGSAHPPSFFDATTAAALLLFAEQGVERTVLEVGLGGRLDSTNAVSPAVTCITTIEYEHTDKLGNTLAAIAREKAGILKPGVPCVIGALPGEAADVVRARAEELDAPAMWLGEDFGLDLRPRVEPGEQALDPACATAPTPVSFWSSSGWTFDAELAVRGHHQLDNAAVAIAAIRALGEHSDDALAASARHGLASAALPARVEVLEQDPFVIVDSAHTRESARALRGFLDELGERRIHYVLSVSADKALDVILDALIPDGRARLVSSVTVTRAEPTRGLEPERIAAVLASRRPELLVRVIADAPEAVRSVRAGLGTGEVLCVTGSIYLAGIARDTLAAS